MFDRLRKKVAAKAAEVRELSAVPPDLLAVPSVHGADLTAIDIGVLSAYLGRPVVSVLPIGALGPQATSLLGQRLQDRLRAASAGAEPGELVAGQAAAREAKMRADGMTEEQIRMIREQIERRFAEHTRDGWELVFSHDHRASVQVFAAGTEGAAEFERLEARWARENGTDGHRPQDTPVLAATVQRVTGSPYESYCLTGTLVAKGEAHVAVAKSAHVSTMVLAGVAAVAVRAAEHGASPS